MGRVFVILLGIFLLSASLFADEDKWSRPIGFSLNLMSPFSLTYEGRAFLGLSKRFSLVLAPSFQYIPQIPWYSFKEKRARSFNVRRAHGGIGIKTHFYDYDSKDGYYLEAMGKAGATWFGGEKNFSVIPSLLFGYSAIYDSGYFVSFGLGLEYEFLFNKKPKKFTKHMKSAYYRMTKMPIKGEFSIGWIF